MMPTNAEAPPATTDRASARVETAGRDGLLLLRSMSAGTMYLPLPSITLASAGMESSVRRPAARTRPPAVRTRESVSGGPPAPSMRTAPTIAIVPVSSAGLHEARASRRAAAAANRMTPHHSGAGRGAAKLGKVRSVAGFRVWGYNARHGNARHIGRTGAAGGSGDERARA